MDMSHFPLISLYNYSPCLFLSIIPRASLTKQEAFDKWARSMI